MRVHSDASFGEVRFVGEEGDLQGSVHPYHLHLKLCSNVGSWLPGVWRGIADCPTSSFRVQAHTFLPIFRCRWTKLLKGAAILGPMRAQGVLAVLGDLAALGEEE